MLRISLKDQRNLMEFQKLHPDAKKKGFGRIFRSPTIFEDVIKSILLCNCMWKMTLDMAKALCLLQSDIVNGLIAEKCENLAEPSTRRFRKRKRNKTTQKQNRVKESGENCLDSELLKLGEDDRALGNFPSSKEVAAILDVNMLKKHYKIGHRAESILQFARDVESGKLNLKEFEEAFDHQTSSSYDVIYQKLNKIKGFGPFTCANVMICIGFYQLVPIDSETIRHLQQVHGRKVHRKMKAETLQQHVKDIYDKFAPFQSLAYWFELLEYYENKFGKLSELSKSSYKIVTGSH